MATRWWDTNISGGIPDVTEATVSRRKSILEEAAKTDFSTIAGQHFLFHAGKDNEGRPVYALHNKNFWQKDEPGFWNKALLYFLKAIADVSKPFSVVYVHDSRVPLPSFHWLRRLYLFTDPEARANLHSLFVLNPSSGSNAVACFFERVLKAQLVGRLTKLDKPEQLLSHMGQDIVDQVSALAPPEASPAGGSAELASRKDGQVQKLASKGMLGVRVWKKRYAVLTDETLHYFPSPTARDPKGVVLLEGVTVEYEHKKRKNSLALHLPEGGEVVYFSFASAQEAEEWKAAIEHHQKTHSVFAVPLQQHLHATGRLAGVPLLVDRCVSVILERGLEKEGVLRVPGSANRIQQLKKSFDLVGDAELSDERDVHTVVGLLKLYLRELPEPVVPSSSFSALVHALDGAESGELISDAHLGAMSDILSEIPDPSKRLLLQMLRLGAEIASESDANKMPALNVATVLGPNLLRPDAARAADPVSALVEAPLVNRACLAMICHVEALEAVLQPNRESIMTEHAFVARMQDKLAGNPPHGLETLQSGRDGRKERPLSSAKRSSAGRGGNVAAGVARAGSQRSVTGSGEVDRCQALVDQAPESGEAWERLAAAYNDSHQYERALQAYDKAIELNPANGQNYIRVGLLCEMTGDFDRAKDMYIKCKKLAGGVIAQHMLQDLSRRLQDHLTAGSRSSEGGGSVRDKGSNTPCSRQSSNHSFKEAAVDAGRELASP